jgi:hypothetical protein
MPLDVCVCVNERALEDEHWLLSSAYSNQVKTTPPILDCIALDKVRNWGYYANDLWFERLLVKKLQLAGILGCVKSPDD